MSLIREGSAFLQLMKKSRGGMNDAATASYYPGSYRMVSMRSCNFIVTLIGLLLGGAIMSAAARFPLEITEQGPGAGFWPFLLGAALVVAAVSLALYTMVHRAALTEEKVALGTAANRQAYVMIGLILLFCAMIHLIGFYPAAALLIPCVMYRLECRDKKRMLLTAAGVVLFIYLVFGQLLHTSLPSSVFLE